ncbi:MAG TPA: SRPBCC family protein [Kutzneria sp.]|jgi:hypothetical protein
MSVVKTVTVQAGQQHAFKVFTAGFATWWPSSHHIGKADMAEAILEQREGGRWYERGVDGSECDWGTVLVYDAPNRVVVSWHLNGEWAYDPDPAKASEVEVRFIAEGPDVTRVELEHRHLERHGGDWEAVARGVGGDGGWAGILRGYSEVAAA